MTIVLLVPLECPTLLGLALHWRFPERQRAFGPCKGWHLCDTGPRTHLRAMLTC